MRNRCIAVGLLVAERCDAPVVPFRGHEQVCVIKLGFACRRACKLQLDFHGFSYVGWEPCCYEVATLYVPPVSVMSKVDSSPSDALITGNDSR
jgi:hypothetical protein